MDATALMLSIVFGSIGMGMFVYGKKMARFVPLLAGLLLMVVPYFVPDPWAMTGVCGALIALPCFVSI